MAVNGASKVKGPTVPGRTPFVLGSRPSGVRAPAPPRIKPAAAGTRDYLKTPAVTPNPAGASFGNTANSGLT